MRRCGKTAGATREEIERLRAGGRLVYLVALTTAAVVFYGWGAGALVALSTFDVEV